MKVEQGSPIMIRVCDECLQNVVDPDDPGYLCSRCAALRTAENMRQAGMGDAWLLLLKDSRDTPRPVRIDFIPLLIVVFYVALLASSGSFVAWILLKTVRAIGGLL